MVKSVASRLVKTLIALAVMLLVVVAVVVGVARQLVHQAGEFQSDIAALLSEYSGFAIEFDSLSGSWHGLAPRIRIGDFRLRQAADGPVVLQAREIDLEVLLLQSTLHLQPRVRLTIDGLALTLVRETKGFSVEGLLLKPATDGEAFNPRDFMELLAAQPKLSLINSRIQFKGLYSQDVGLQVQQLKIESGRFKRYSTGNVLLQGPSPLSIAVRAQVRGSFLQWDSLSGELYLDVANADWLPWLPENKRGLGAATITSLKGGTESWISVKNGKLIDVTSRFLIHDFTLNSQNQIQAPQVQSLSGVTRWHGDQSGGWQAAIEHLRMVTSNFSWQPSVFNIAARPLPESGQQYGVELDDADITPWLNYFLSLQSEDNTLYEAMNALRPSGKLNKIVLSIDHQAEQFSNIRFAANIEQFNCKPWNKLPGVKDLDIRLWGKQGLYLAKLDDDYLELDYPYLFRDNLVMRLARGSLAVQQSDAGWQLQSGLMQINTDDARTATQFSLMLPADKAQPPFLQLQSTLRDVDASKKSRYLPAGIIPPNLLKWLDDSILAGRLTRGDIVVHGPLGHDWVDDRNVLLGFSVDDASLQFLPDWTEPVRHGQADVIVDNGAVWAEAVSGQYYQQQVAMARVEVPHVEPGAQHMLSVKARTGGRAEQGFAVLQQTPLATMVGDIIQDMTVGGDLTVDLDLHVPLNPGEQKTAVDVNVVVDNGHFHLTSQNLDVSNLGAMVHFDLVNGLAADSLAGTAFAGPVSGSIKTVPVAKGGQLLKLKFKGNAQVDAVRDWIKLSLMAPLEGKLDYTAELQLPMGAAKQQKFGFLNLTSKLRQTGINLPTPYGKAPDQQRDFRVWQSLGREPSFLSVRYADLFEISLQNAKGKLQKGMLSLGGSKAELPSGNYFAVNGTLPRLDLAEWQPVLAQLQSASADLKENINVDRIGVLNHSSLGIGDFILDGKSWGAVQINLQRQNQQWGVQLSGDSIAGKLAIPFYVLNDPATFATETAPLHVELDHLVVPVPVPVPATGTETEAAPAPVETPWQPGTLSPLQLPPANIVINDLRLGEGSYGRWALKLRRVDNGMQLKDVNVQMRGVDFFGSGLWLDQDNERQVALSGDFRSNNIAEVMRAWGSEPTMSSKAMNGSLDISWPGAPYEFSLLRSQGSIKTKLEDGSFYNVESGVAGKFWGALNFETLLRRLQLNFKDLSDKDMVYDEISATARLNKGVLHLSELSLDSPAIKLQTKGDIDLRNSQLDLVMRVTVPVTRNLVIPAAAIGGVPAAATVFLIEKILGDQFDKLTTLKYSVKGNFDQPKVEAMKSFSLIPKAAGDSVMKDTDSSGTVETRTETAPAVVETQP